MLLLSELAGRDLRLPLVRIQLVLDGHLSVEPVLDMIAFDHDPPGVPLADRIGRAHRRRLQVVVVTGEVGVHLHRAHLDVGCVVEHLVLGRDLPQALAFLLLHAVEDAAVSFRADLEVEDDLEVREFGHGEDVSAFHGAARQLADELASLDLPVSGREVLAAVSPPTVRRDAVEEEDPAGGLLFDGEDVARRRVGHRLLSGRVVGRSLAPDDDAQWQQARVSREGAHKTSVFSGSHVTTLSSK